MRLNTVDVIEYNYSFMDNFSTSLTLPTTKVENNCCTLQFAFASFWKKCKIKDKKKVFFFPKLKRPKKDAHFSASTVTFKW